MKIQNSKFKMQNCSSKFKIFGFVLNFALLILIFNFALLTFNLGKAEASALSLGISPPILQIEAMPPSDIKTPINVENSSDDPVELDIIFKSFTAGDENGQVKFLSGKESYKYNRIFQKMQVLEKDHVVKSTTLAPGQEKQFILHIGIDKDIPVSDYYFSIVFISKAIPIKSGQQEQSNISQTPGGIAANVLLTVGKKGKADGLIEEFSTPFVLEKGPVPFTVRIKNTGKNVIAPNGQILIRNMFGQTVGKVDLLPVNILSSTIRSLPDSMQSPGATPSAILNSLFLIPNSVKAFWLETFLLGPYTATLNIALSDQGPLFTRTIYFVGLPLQVIAGIIITILVVIFIKSRLRTHTG